MEQREQNDNKHSERKQHINAVIKRSDAMRETERDIRSAYEEFMEKGDEETRKVLHETKYNWLYQQCVQESIGKFAEGAVQAEGSGNGGRLYSDIIGNAERGRNNAWK